MNKIISALIVVIILLGTDAMQSAKKVKELKEENSKIISNRPIIPDTLLTTDGKKVDTLFIYKQPVDER